MLESCVSEKQMIFWNDLYEPDHWKKTHMNNFKCSISTRIRSFYFKLFYRAIGLNDFLSKIKIKDSPNWSFCNITPETYNHIFIECPVVKPIWDEVIKVIIQKINKPLNVSTFEKMFGFDDDKFLTHLFLLLKYYIYIANSKTNHQILKVIKHTLLLTKILNIVLPGKITNFKFIIRNGGLKYECIVLRYCYQFYFSFLSPTYLNYLFV